MCNRIIMNSAAFEESGRSDWMGRKNSRVLDRRSNMLLYKGSKDMALEKLRIRNQCVLQPLETAKLVRGRTVKCGLFYRN